MKEIFDTLVKNWDFLSTWLQLLIILLTISFVFASIFNKYIPIFTYFKTIRKKSVNKKIKKLKEHNFFSGISYLRNYKIKFFDLEDETRTYVLKELLFPLKMYEFEVSIKNLIEKIDFENFSSDKIKSILINQIYDSIESYEKKFLKFANTKDEEEVLKIVLKKFNEVHLKTGNLSINMITQIFESNVFSDNFLKMESALYILLMPFEYLFTEGEKSFKLLNGQLNGKSIHSKKFKKI